MLIINDHSYYAKLDGLISETQKFPEITISDDKFNPMISEENSIARFKKSYTIHAS